MTVKELADLCKVHYNTMRKWLADNKIKKADKAVNSPYLITDDVVKKAKKHFLNEDLKPEEYKKFKGYEYTKLFVFFRGLYGGEKLQNHALNSKVID